MDFASSASDFVSASKSEIRVRPREPAVSVLGRLMVTAASSDVVQGGDFRTRSFAPGRGLAIWGEVGQQASKKKR
jgi:hypothetical protein